MLKDQRITLFLLLMIMFFAMPLRARNRETGFLNRSVQVGGTVYRYQVFIPAEWSKNKKWPVILYLHGAGERGEDGLIQTEVGIGTAIRRHAERFPSIVVFPQCRKNSWWTHPEMQAQALKALDQTMKEFNGDVQRVYLTGISMGGYGTWSIAAKYPGKFAALAPVCGGIRLPERVRNIAGNPPEDQSVDPYLATAQKIAKIPIWVFHGSADTTVPTSESQKMVAALKAAGANVKYSEYEGVGHNSWDRAYAEPDLMPWLLSQSLGLTSHSTAQQVSSGSKN